MLIPLLLILVGFVLLIWSAERFVMGCSAAASHLGMSPLLIGIIIVGFGTSLPEMIVSAQAALASQPSLAIGNAIGSNIINTALVLGLTALIAPIAVHSGIVSKEIPMLIGITLVFGFMVWDGSFTRLEALVLISGFFLLIAWSIYTSMRADDDHLGAEVQAAVSSAEMSLKSAITWLLIGLLILMVSSNVLVMGATSVAEQLGISNLIIGLTIVAFGTSLPELAASIVAARKGQHDIAIGNVVGSNMFNLLAVTGIAGTIAPIPELESDILKRDWPVVLGLTLALWMMAYGYGKPGQISRKEGAVLLTAFIVYTALLINAVS
jgi:cation:H+ antiporter